MSMPSIPAIDSLNRFLFDAKQATYAGQGDTASGAPLLPDSRQLEYAEGEFLYRDIYVGLNRFVGQEIVYMSGRAVWSMSYSGGLCQGVEFDSAGAIYAFLRQAMRAAPADLPLRGPECFEAGSLRFSCQISGTVEQFHGVENITDGELRRYELNFSGGRLA